MVHRQNKQIHKLIKCTVTIQNRIKTNNNSPIKQWDLLQVTTYQRIKYYHIYSPNVNLKVKVSKLFFNYDKKSYFLNGSQNVIIEMYNKNNLIVVNLYTNKK